MRQYIIAGLAAGLMAGALIAAVPPARAGCGFIGSWEVCDGPIQPDGTWERCAASDLGQDLLSRRCFPLGDGHPSLFGPPEHVDP
ncbi:MAG: hypothetical protein J2P17_04430 [Mycobacterium sp.]|nr:hypothetical protein [Mycobacterium sp.]